MSAIELRSYDLEEPALADEGEHEMPTMIYKQGIEASCGCELFYGFELPQIDPADGLLHLTPQLLELDRTVMVKCCDSHASSSFDQTMSKRYPTAPPSFTQAMALFGEVLAGL